MVVPLFLPTVRAATFYTLQWLVRIAVRVPLCARARGILTLRAKPLKVKLGQLLGIRESISSEARSPLALQVEQHSSAGHSNWGIIKGFVIQGSFERLYTVESFFEGHSAPVNRHQKFAL